MPMDRQTKQKVREQVAETLSKTSGVIVAQYSGMTVKDVTDLRVELRKVNAEFRVVKNRIVKKAIEQAHPEMAPLAEKLKGHVGIIYSYGDIGQIAKTTVDFQKSHAEKFEVKDGHIDNSLVSADDVKEIASLPSKEEMLAKIIGSIVAPHRGLVTVLSGVSRELVQVINQIKEQKSA